MKVGFSIKGLYQYYHMIKPIINANTNNSIEFYIFHLDTYYKYSDDIVVIDDAITINLIDELNIVKIIKDSNLDFMIFFSPGQIFDVFITAICKENKIKTIYYQHGLGLPFGSFSMETISRGKSITDRIKSFRRYLYFYSTISANTLFVNNKIYVAKLILKRSVQVFFMHGSSIYPKYGLKEFHCDIGLVYGENDKEYLIKSNGFKVEDIYVGGYPILRSSGQNNGLPKNFILYISSGLLASKVIPSSIQEERNFYISLANKAKNKGNNLVIKLHPTEDLDLFQNYVEGYKNVFVYKDYNLSDLVERANLVIGDYSTALFYPIKYKKPLILLQSKFFKKYPFDFSDYGVGEKVGLEQLDRFINTPRKPNEKNYIDFMKKYISSTHEGNSIDVLYQEILRAR